MTEQAATGLLDDAAVGRILFGRGQVAAVPSEVERLRAKSALVISTRSQNAAADPVIRALGERFGDRLDGVAMHVPRSDVDRALRVAGRCRADCVVAIGGGSAIGLAKAVALDRDVAIVAVPSTYSGSEMTDIWGIGEAGGKVTGRDPRVVPAVAIYDAELTRTLPKRIAAPSGINTIAHSVEALYAQNGTPELSRIAEEGIGKMASALRVLCGPERGTEVAEPALDMALYGAALCGSALARATMGIHHKLCHILGGSFGLPHAETHTVILPHATAYNREVAGEAMKAVCRALGTDSAPAGLQELAREVDAPTSLLEIGFDESALDRAAEIATESPYFNPRPVDYAGVRALLDDAFHGRDVD